MKTKIPINKIIEDPRLQPRAEFSQQTINDYAIAMQSGDNFPEIDVFEDGKGRYLLVHGFHRFRAALKADLAEIDAEIHTGDIHDAILFAAKSNCGQDKVGMRRTNADKIRAVEMVLADENLAKEMNDQDVANAVGVGLTLVWRIRKKKEVFFHKKNCLPSKKRTGKDGKKYPIKKPRPSPFDNDPLPTGPMPNEDPSQSSPLDRVQDDPNLIQWDQEFERLRDQVREVVNEFKGYKAKLEGLFGEIREFRNKSKLDKEAQKLTKELFGVRSIGDWIRQHVSGL
jgi:hypothetical protein